MSRGCREAILLLTLACIWAQSEYAQDLAPKCVYWCSSMMPSLSSPFTPEECATNEDMQGALLQIMPSSSLGGGVNKNSTLVLYTGTQNKSRRRLLRRARNGFQMVSICVLGAAVLAYHGTECDEAKEETVPCEHSMQDQEQPDQKYTKWEAIFALSNIGIGGNLFAIPFCLSRAGAAGFGLMALIGFILGVTATSFAPSFQAALIHAGASAQGLDGWHIVSHEAFGTIGVLITAILVPLDIFFASLNCILIGGDVLPEILPTVASKETACIICGAIGFILTLSPPAWIPRIAVAGSLATSAIIASLIATSVSILRPGSTASLGVHNLSFEMDTMLGFGGVFLAGLNVHQFLPFFYARLRDKSEWTAVAGASLSACCGFYLLVGMIAFFLFGDSTKQVFVHNLGRDGRDKPLYGLEFLAPLCSGLVAVQQISMLPTVAYALKDEFPSCRQLGPSSIGVSVILAILGERMLPYILALEGSTIDFEVAIFIPAMAYLSLKWADLTLCWRCMIGIVVMLCCVGTLAGVVLDSEVIVGEKAPLDTD